MPKYQNAQSVSLNSSGFTLVSSRRRRSSIIYHRTTSLCQT